MGAGICCLRSASFPLVRYQPAWLGLPYIVLHYHTAHAQVVWTGDFQLDGPRRLHHHYRASMPTMVLGPRGRSAMGSCLLITTCTDRRE